MKENNIMEAKDIHVVKGIVKQFLILALELIPDKIQEHIDNKNVDNDLYYFPIILEQEKG